MNIGRTLLLVACALTLAACTAAPPIARAPGPMYVATGVQTGSDASAWFILPTNSMAEAAIPRGERTALAPDIAVGSAFTDYTFDVQPIGIPNGYGYRYRSVIRTGVSLP